MADTDSDSDSGIYKIAAQLRAESRSLYNRLRSIEADGDFVRSAASAQGSYPVVANERCGLWYVDPTLSYAQTVYFKSTDGHAGQWRFSLRRANTHLLSVLASHGGCILVDSTRRGKSMPDAFARTVPLWCAVWNAAMGRDATVHVPEHIVSPSEQVQMQALVAGFAAQLQESAIDVAAATRGIDRPLQPLWVGHDSSVHVETKGEFIPVICLCASAAQADVRVEGMLGGRPSFRYVQGAADDHETWALGLTPRLFWKHRRTLLAGSPDTCEPAVRRLVSEAEDVSEGWFSFVRQTNVAVGGRLAGRPPECWANFDTVINCGAPEYPANVEAAAADGSLSGRYLFLPIPEGKRGQVELGKAIGPALDFVRALVSDPTKRVLVHCSQGADRSVGIALAILTRYFGDDEKYADVAASAVSKESIRSRLLWITTSRTKANPSRATLKQVNRYFLDILVADGTYSLGHNHSLGSSAMLDRALNVIKSEWRRFEYERADWDVERIRLKAKLAACEKRIEHLHAQYTASQRQVAILESLINTNQTMDDSSRQAVPPLSSSQQPSSDAVSHLVRASSMRTQHSRELLQRCLREIDVLLNPPVQIASPAIIAGTGSPPPPPPPAVQRAGSPAPPKPKSPLLPKALRRKSADAVVVPPDGVIETEVTSVPLPWQIPAPLSRSPATTTSKSPRASTPEPRPVRELSEKRRRRSQSSLVAAQARQPSIFESQEFTGLLPPLPKPASAPPVNSPVSNDSVSNSTDSDDVVQLQVQELQVATDIDDEDDEENDSARLTIETLKVDEVDQGIDVLKVGPIDQKTIDSPAENVASYDGEWQVTKTFVGHLDTVRAVGVRQIGSTIDADGMGTQVLSGGDDGLVILWDIDRSMRKRSRRRGAGNVGPQTIFRGHLAAVTSVALDALHGYAYSGSLDHTVNVWALPGGEHWTNRFAAAATAADDSAEMCFAQRAFTGHSDAVWGLALSVRAGLLASVSADATCRVWSTDPRYASVAQRACLVANDAAASARLSLVPTAARFVSNDGSQLAVAYASGHLGVHDVSVGSSSPLVFGETHAQLARITDIAWQEGAAPASTTIAVACVDGSVHLYDLRTGGAAVSLRRADGLQAAATMCVDFVPNSTCLVAGASDGIVSLWDWRSPQAAVREVTRHRSKGDEGVCSVAAFGGQSITVASAGADGRIVFASPAGSGQ